MKEEQAKKLKSMTLEEFLRALAAKEPAPGGGSAAALAGAMAAALTAFVCRVTIGKKKYPEAEKELTPVLDKADDLRQQLLLLIDEDKIAYAHVVACGHSRDSIARAASVARTIAAKAEEAAELAGIAAAKGNKNAASDATAALLLARAAKAASDIIAKINERELESK